MLFLLRFVHSWCKVGRVIIVERKEKLGRRIRWVDGDKHKQHASCVLMDEVHDTHTWIKPMVRTVHKCEWSGGVHTRTGKVWYAWDWCEWYMCKWSACIHANTVHSMRVKEVHGAHTWTSAQDTRENSMRYTHMQEAYSAPTGRAVWSTHVNQVPVCTCEWLQVWKYISIYRGFVLITKTHTPPFIVASSSCILLFN